MKTTSFWAQHSTDEHLIAAAEDPAYTREAVLDAIEELTNRGHTVIFAEKDK